MGIDLINQELDDALNLQRMYKLVVEGEVTIEDYNDEVIAFNKKWGYVEELD